MSPRSERQHGDGHSEAVRGHAQWPLMCADSTALLLLVLGLLFGGVDSEASWATRWDVARVRAGGR